MLHSKASLGGIPSPGTTCSKAWNKVFQILEQVIGLTEGQVRVMKLY